MYITAFLLLLVSFISIAQVYAADCPQYWEEQTAEDERVTGKKIDLHTAVDLVLDPKVRPDILSDNNDCGQLAWFETRRLEGYLDMYLATMDEKYLDGFMVVADRIYLANDIFSNKADELRKRVAFGWSSIKYTEFNERHVHGVQSGIFAEMYARFARTVLEKNLERYFAKASLYKEIAEKALAEVEEDWNSRLGFYRFKRRAHKKFDIYPYNQGLAMGSGYLELYKLAILDNDSARANELKEKIELIGRYFMRSVYHDRYKNRYLWKYAPESYYEDMSHLSLDLNFVRKAYESNLIFDEQDMERFSNTVEHSYNFKKKRYGRYIDGFELEGFTNWHGLTCLMLVDFSLYSNSNSILKNCESAVSEIIYDKKVIKNLGAQYYLLLMNGLPKLFSVKKN